jgi:2'-5' RNA ligase
LNSIGYRDLFRNTGRWLLKWRHPLWWLPDVPSEQDEAYRRIWANLRQVDQVVDGRHDTEDWYHRGGDFVYVCARIPEDALSPAYDELVATLSAFSFARPVPRSFLNITLQELGYLTERSASRDEITNEWLDEFIQQAAVPIQSFSPFDVTLGGANSFVDAAFVDVHDNGWLSRIHVRLLDFVSQPPSMRYAYLPELIVAQYVEVAPVKSLVRKLTPFRDATFGSFRVSHIDIMRVSTSEAFAKPELVHRFELGHEPGLIDRVSPAEPEATLRARP